MAWLPPDLFVSNAPSHLRYRVPHVEDTAQGKQWYAEGNPLGFVAGAVPDVTWERYVPGTSQRLDRMEEFGFFSDADEGLFHPTDPELRIKDQDLDGVSGEVLYGILGVASWFNPDQFPPITGDELLDPGYGIKDPDVLALVYEIYNEWIAEFCKSSPNRFAGLACLTGHDPRLAAQQLTRAADIGLRGAELNISSLIEPVYHRDWDVLWAAAADCKIPISFHTLGLSHRVPKISNRDEYRWISGEISYTLFQLSGAEYLSSIILSGACDRYPDFKFVLGECGIGWIPYILQRMDEVYEHLLLHLDLSLKPSEFWRRQGYSTFQNEHLTVEVVKLVGEDNIIWGSDYPHPEGLWPDSRRIIQEKLGHLDEGVLRKIVCTNTATLYGFQADG